MANLDQYLRKPKANLSQYQRNKPDEASAPEDNENLFQKAIRYGLKDPAIGVLNMGREFANLPSKLSGGRIPEFSPSDFDFGKTLGVENPEPTDKLIQFAGQYGPSFAIPSMGLGRAGQALGAIPKIGRYAAKAVSEAIPQGLYSAAQAPNDQLAAGAETAAVQAPFSALGELMQGASKKGRLLAQAGLGLGGAYLGREGAKAMGFGETGSDVAAMFAGALGARGLESDNAMMRKLTKGVNLDFAQERQLMANKLGLDYLTPAEAGISNPATAQQFNLGKTAEGSKMIYDRSMSRRGSERDAINKTLELVYSENKMGPKIAEAYEAMKPVNMSADFPLQYADNAIIKAAEKRVKSRPAYQESLKKLLPENVRLQEGQTDAKPTSLVYWDHVKRALYDMEQEAGRKGSGGEANILKDARRDMVKQMDEQYPEYANARALYERKQVRKGLEKVFDQKEVNGQNFYRALASQNKFDELMVKLKNAPEASENLKAMRELFNNLMGPPTIKTVKGREEHGMTQARNVGNYLENVMQHIFTGGANDEKAIKFITSKDWLQQLEEINEIADKQMKSVAFGLALSKGVSQAAGQQDRKPMELELVGGRRV